MSLLYVTEHGSVVGLDGGNLVVRHTDESENYIPRNTVEGIAIFSKSNLTTQCMEYCLKNGIRVSFFSSSGQYKGNLNPGIANNIERIEQQILRSKDQRFALEISKDMIAAKINNQNVIAKRYLKSNHFEPKEELFQIRNAKRKVPYVDDIRKLRGYEGLASREYFHAINKIIDPDFRFRKRSAHPAFDPFNAMLNMGYSILLSEIIGVIENRGLSAYRGFMHTTHDKIPALACDMLEEWRPAIIDSTVISLINGHEIKKEMFEYTKECCRMSNEAIRIFLRKLEEKMYTEMKYLDYLSYPVTFRQAIWYQCDRMMKAIENCKVDLYHPILLR